MDFLSKLTFQQTKNLSLFEKNKLILMIFFILNSAIHTSTIVVQDGRFELGLAKRSPQHETTAVHAQRSGGSLHHGVVLDGHQRPSL